MNENDVLLHVILRQQHLLLLEVNEWSAIAKQEMWPIVPDHVTSNWVDKSKQFLKPA